MKLNWKRSRAEILCGAADAPTAKTVVGRGTGNWLVHKASGDNTAWSVTHKPSGRELAKLSTQQECIDLIEHLSKKVFGFTHLGVGRIKQRGEHISKVMCDWIESNTE